FSDTAVANQLGHTVVHRQRAIFRARLEDALMLANLVDEDSPFGDSERRFLTLNILSGPQRHHTYQCVPVVRRRNHYGIDVFSINDLAKILRGGAILVVISCINNGLGLAHAKTVYVANSENAGLG